MDAKISCWLDFRWELIWRSLTPRHRYSTLLVRVKFEALFGFYRVLGVSGNGVLGPDVVDGIGCVTWRRNGEFVVRDCGTEARRTPFVGNQLLDCERKTRRGLKRYSRMGWSRKQESFLVDQDSRTRGREAHGNQGRERGRGEDRVGNLDYRRLWRTLTCLDRRSVEND